MYPDVSASQTLSGTDAAVDDDSGGRTVSLRIPAKAEYITLCRLALTGIGRLRELSDELLADLKLALTEAASNSVRHAYRENQGVGPGWHADRPRVVTASGRNLPALMCGMAGTMSAKTSCTCPATRSDTACTVPLYGM